MSSRRKQGRPQQRKTLDSLEQENDLLVCGDCQTSFPLHDIVQFIKHKNHACNKENVEQSCSPPSDNGEEDGDRPTDLSSSKVKAKEGGGDGWLGDRGSGTPCSRDGASSVHSVEMRDDSRERMPLRPKQVVDAEANTTHSEPSKFVCDTCRLTLSSAWALLQHAQKEHGMKIYNIGATTPTPPSGYHHGPVPQPAHSHSHSHAPPPPVPTPDMTTPSPRPNMDHRTPPSSAGSGPSSPFPGGHPLNPFTPFRMPLDSRLPPSPFNRPPGLDLPIDLLEHYRMRPHLGTVVMTPSPNMEPHFAHSAFDRTRMSTLETQIYSQRLKQLANTTLPPGLMSPLPGAHFTQPGVLTPIPTSERGSRGGRDSVGSGRDSSSGGLEHDREREERGREGRSGGDERSGGSRSEGGGGTGLGMTPSSVLSALPSKLKSCEFCGKMFRFQSNLIVHRRSHTGEKPFKCPLCPHACTQQSKLKRHMKTHSAQGTRGQSLTSNTGSSDGSVRSTTSTPDSTRNKDDLYGLEDDDGDDDIDDEEDDDDEEDMEEDVTDGELESGQEGESNDGFHAVKRESGGDGKLVDGQSDRASGSPDDGCAPTPTKCSASASLVSDLMKNSGLNSIQPYNEAFKAALAEKFQTKENGEREGDEENQMKRERSPSSRGSGSVFLGHTDLLGDKSIKREPGDAAAAHLDSGSPHSLFGRPGFPRWLPGDPTHTMRTFFPGFPPTFAMQHDFGRDSHNGFSPSSPAALAASDSALKVPASLTGLVGMSKPGPSTPSSLLSASNGSSVIGPRSKDKRNDTCEFCGKVFKNCSNLTVHRRSHTGEKPYKCSLCNYACAQSSKLTRHMKTHGRLGKDVFKCKFCNMPFSVPSTLEKHMRKCVESRNARILAEHDNSDNSTSASNMASRSTPQPGTPEEVSLEKDMERRGMGVKSAEASWSY